MSKYHLLSSILAAGCCLCGASAEAQKTPAMISSTVGARSDEGGGSFPGEAGAKRERVKFAVSYSIGLPAMDLHDFTGIASFRGFDFAVLWPVFRGLHVGPGLGFNSFYDDKPRGTYQLTSESAITAKVYRYADYWTISGVARYIFRAAQASIRPFAGLRAGVAALSTTSLVVDTSRQDAPVGFLMVPEAGVLVEFSRSLFGSISLQYNFSTASTTSFNNLSFGAIQLGLTIQ